MTEPNHDLSKLKIRRDQPSPSTRKALKRAGWLAGFAVVFLAVVIVMMRGSGATGLVLLPMATWSHAPRRLSPPRSLADSPTSVLRRDRW